MERLADHDLEGAPGGTLDPADGAPVEPLPDVAGARVREGRPVGPRPPIAGDPAVDAGGGSRATCTAPQLRRFIKSRAYVPMHELRRRFAINGDDDDVCAIELDGGRIYVGLPAPEGRMLGDLVRNGEIGYELSMDPRTPVVVGVYSMRPVTRL